MPPIAPHAPETTALTRMLRGAGKQVSWRELENIAGSPEFQRFITIRYPALSPMLTGPSRRRLLQVMAASFAFAGVSGAAYGGPLESYRHIVPFVRQPAGAAPATPQIFASAYVLDGIANGILVTTIDGRPIKIEGNPEHPWSKGGTDAFAQALVLGLYDPDRSQSVRHFDEISSWETFQAAMLPHFQRLVNNNGKGLYLLTGQITSPSLLAEIQRLQTSMGQMQWHVHAPCGRNESYQGTKQVFGQELETRWDFKNVDVILSLDADFLDAGPQQIGAARAWVDARRAAAKAGRLLPMYAVAPFGTLTYAKADDHRLMAQRDLIPFARAILADISGSGSGSGSGQPGPAAEWRAKVVAALTKHRGRGLVLTGTHQSAELHAIVHHINAALGNTNGTVQYTAPIVPRPESFDKLLAALQNNQVDTLIMLDVNPVYTAPGDSNFTALLSKVPTKLHVGLHTDETALRSTWHLPLAHTLETWGDARALDGTVTLIQPTMMPVYDVRSAHEVLWLLTHPEPRDARALLQDYWRGELGAGNFDSQWHKALELGFLAGSALPPINVKPVQPPAQPPGTTTAAPGPELVFRPDPAVWDGRFSNNSWLQELPKPTSKIVWDNAVFVSRKLADQLKLENGNILQLESASQRVAGPVWINSVQNDDTVVVTLGYGRASAGTVGNDVGYDAYRIRRLHERWHSGGVKLKRLGSGVAMATTQQLQQEEGHNFVRVQPMGGKPVGDDSAFNQPTLYKRAPSDGRSWGMVIDLDACIGCNACVVACQAENNIPVVSKDQVLAGRDMHWLRVDCYFTGSEDNQDTRFMPVPCMMCELAPCELGCPVEATLHDDEGLNLMIYNRCIGTRACNAYCPYKVRHFNYMYYSDAPVSIQAQRNPEVTVRARGVMEKCTYCVQRIVAGRITADREHRPIRDGEVVTACAAACPTRAIIFGDLEDKTSAVAAARQDPGNYALLGELNTRPHTTYLPVLGPPNQNKKG